MVTFIEEILNGKLHFCCNESNYFRFNFLKETNLVKCYLLPKMHKGLWKVPGRPLISNCGTPTEKVSNFLDHHLQPMMKQGNDGLMYKLKHLVICGKYYGLIHSFQNGRYQRVVLNGQHSNWSKVKAVDLQDSMLGALFFLV